SVKVGTFIFNLLNVSNVILFEDVIVATLLNLQSGSIKKSTGNIVMAANSTINRNLGSLVSAPVFSGATNIIYSTAANITGGAELQGTGGSIKNLTLSMSGSSVLGLFSNLSITGVLTINPGSVFNPGGKTITLSDNFVNNGIFNSNISTIVIAGNTTISGTPESGGFNFYNLTINNGATLTAPASASLLINNTFSPISGSTFNANNGTVNFQDQSGNQAIPGKIQYYNLTLSNSSQKILSVTDTIKIGNILSISGGGVTVANSTINFNGGVQTINNLAYNNLILSGSGLKTPETSSLTANNIIISGSAILNGANATINATGNWTSYGAGAYVNTSGTVIFNNAASPITIDGNGVTFNDITFASAGNKTIISAVSVNGILTLTSGTLYTGDLLSVNLTTGAISGAGSGTLSGNVTYTKDVVTAASNFLAFPVSGATGNDLADDFEFVNPSTNKSRLSIWNCATQKYLTGQAVTTTFTQGVGFQFFASVPGTLDVTGAYDHANTGYTITSCTSAANKFVLAGNPYPSTLDWNSSGWTKTNLNDALYFFNPATSTFATYINGTPSNGGSQYIPSFQGFYITTNGAGIGSLTSTNAVRTTLTNPGLYRTANTSTIALEVSYKHYTDEAVIVLNEDASFDFEGDKDAIKLMNPDAAPSLYTKSMGVDYSINSIPSIGTGYVLPLGLSVSETGSYTFTPKNLSDISGSVFLEDKLTGDMIDLKSTPSHTVTIDSTQTNRFQLRFASSGSTTTASASSTKIYYYDGLIHVAFQDASANGNMALYNVLGNTVMDNITINGSGEVATKNIQPGTYIVRVIENGQISTQKIIIQ
ncbi:MAG: T9SS type A sorting domain-containing protein, partial [Cytophaga sp.]|uniref:T9SS type A sorting domain-containing protein n=1 Tax=Cytophaga sp. TaxID=29535 RepID=UPI003F80C667